MRIAKKAKGEEDRPVCFAYAVPMPGHRLLYVWLPVVLTSSVVNAQRLPGSSSALSGSLHVLGSAWLRSLIHSLVVVT
jgi:hypothetical protein